MGSTRMRSVATQVIVIGNGSGTQAALTAALTERGIAWDQHSTDATIEPGKKVAALVLMLADWDEAAQTKAVALLTDLAERELIPVVGWGPLHEQRLAKRQLFDWISAEDPLDAVIGHLVALVRCGPVLRRLNRELAQQERLSKQINRYFEQIDHELRLAGRLQRDFLPRELPDTERLQFASMYRPAVWVSGDIFDIFRVDDRHIAVFLADAMGHGTAAGLITMVLRKSLVPVLAGKHGAQLATPAQVMQQVHDGLSGQALPHSQFATACYALIDTQTLDIQLARGGHPYAIHIKPSGEIREIAPDGGLLGVPGLDLGFDEYCGCVEPGDKLLVYTDGLEPTILVGRDRESGAPEFTDQFHEWAKLPISELVEAIGAHLDHIEGSLNPEDDVTLLAVEVRA